MCYTRKRKQTKQRNLNDDLSKHEAKRVCLRKYLFICSPESHLSCIKLKRRDKREMSQVLSPLQGTLFINHSCNDNIRSLKFVLSHRKRKPHSNSKEHGAFRQRQAISSSLKGSGKVLDYADGRYSLPHQEKDCPVERNDTFPNVQVLAQFPKNELLGKVVMVRFDSTILLSKEPNQRSPSFSSAISTIKYLCNCGAKVTLVSNWSTKNDLELLDTDSVAEFLSGVLQLKVTPAKLSTRNLNELKDENYDILLFDNLSHSKEENANCSNFSKHLSEGVDIFINDAFAQSHRILASTVGITRFCYSCIAGFHFEERLHQLQKIINTNKAPYVAIIGGGKFFEKAAALDFLASYCDGLVFIGMMAFQIMKAQGSPVPLKFVEHRASEEASKIIEIAKLRRIPILCPIDFWCRNDHFSSKLKLFPADHILDGWEPVDIGPDSLQKISSLLSKCEKILWIGPVQFSLPSLRTDGTTKLAKTVIDLAQRNCDVTVVGNMACQALMRVSSSVSAPYMLENASIVWEILKGKKLPGLMALDKAYPLKIDWDDIYTDPTLPLVVDIGSGNGLFLFGMAKRRKDLNFLGLEMNEKLVTRCLAPVDQSDIKNRYFIATNATSTFRSIVSSYPGKLVLVSIQCPNPDFNKPRHRWSMLQRLLVEAIVDLLISNGKVFLQSDIEAVAVRMKEQFLQYGKEKLTLEGSWLKENPFGVRSDWEQHVIDRGDPMYRLMLFKSILSV